MRNRSTLITYIALVFALLLGLFVRILKLTAGDFPLNDGGLFVAMTQDIVRNGYALPAISSYNGINMPFAYPPLGFYLAAWLSSFFPLLDLARFLPTVINLLTIPAFYLLARAILKAQQQAILATIAFAVLPRAFKFMIMGGGLSRSPGFLFAILLLWQAYLLYTTNSRRYLFPTMLLASLTVLSHLEMELYSALSCFLFMLFFQRSRVGIINSALVIAGTLILTSLWWIPVITRHGLTPFLSAFQTGEQSLTISFALLFSGVGFIEQSLLGVFALIGLVKRLADGRYLLPVWLVSIFLIPRSAQTFAVIVVAMLAAVTLDEVILPALNSVSAARSRRSLNVARAVLFFMLIVYSTFTAFREEIPVLDKTERDAMSWVGKNTPQDSHFVVISGYAWYQDTISEWFPLLSERHSVATVQGYEWFPQGEFQKRQQQHTDLQHCATLPCLEAWGRTTANELAYIYVSNAKPETAELRAAIGASPDYEILYNENGVTIFRKRS